jgi:hypothetical protein
MDDDGQCELDVPLFIELKQSAYQNNDLGIILLIIIYFAIILNVNFI